MPFLLYLTHMVRGTMKHSIVRFKLQLLSDISASQEKKETKTTVTANFTDTIITRQYWTSKG